MHVDQTVLQQAPGPGKERGLRAAGRVADQGVGWGLRPQSQYGHLGSLAGDHVMLISFLIFSKWEYIALMILNGTHGHLKLSSDSYRIQCTKQKVSNLSGTLPLSLYLLYKPPPNPIYTANHLEFGTQSLYTKFQTFLY